LTVFIYQQIDSIENKRQNIDSSNIPKYYPDIYINKEKQGF